VPAYPGHPEKRPLNGRSVVIINFQSTVTAVATTFH